MSCGIAGRAICVLAEDAALAADLEGSRKKEALVEIRANAMLVPRGEWAVMAWPRHMRAGAGLLVLDGMLLRRTEVAGRMSAELVGRGDLIRPWQKDLVETADDVERLEWHVLSQTAIAVLDTSFMKRVAEYPEVQARLIERAIGRARYLAVALTIAKHPCAEVRVRLMLIHLASRWGSHRESGLLIPRLSHRTLGELTGVSRPTVTTAVGVMRRRGELESSGEGIVLRADIAETACAE
jgi:CRP/FNR family transcriptional regulator, cyclic AMP receptor protein